MQLLTWPIARLGSRFSLLFEPGHRRVRHSALGRFLDEPLELSAGLVSSGGVERAIPLTPTVEPLYGCEQFPRVNSITFRGYDLETGLRLELNVHSPFYPQNEKLSLLPSFYLEMRVTWMNKIRWRYSRKKEGQRLEKVKLFFRLKRPDTQIHVGDDGQIDLNYQIPLAPRYLEESPAAEASPVQAVERIVSINEGASPDHGDDGSVGLALELPVTEEDSGIKWRLIWAAYVADPVLDVFGEPARLAYTAHWDSLDQVMATAREQRDDRLARSRRFERLLEQTPLSRPAWHMLTYSFQNWLLNTWWCQREDGQPWFSTWEGNCLAHSTLDVEYNTSPIVLALWPELLRILLRHLPAAMHPHEASGGRIVQHDFGARLRVGESSFHHSMPVEENSNALLLLRAVTRWWGETDVARELEPAIRQLTEYLLWTDRDGSGFPSEGMANTVDDASPALQYARKQTYLAIKRVAGLQAAADLMQLLEDPETAGRYREAARTAAGHIEREAWLGDHFAVCVDSDATGLRDVWTDEPLPPGKLGGWDDYSIFTANGLLLSLILDQPVPFDTERMVLDLKGALRETLTPYGCTHTSSDTVNVWISQNIWRDLIARYLEVPLPDLSGRYWDMQTYANTCGQSYGYCDTYVGNELTFYPRGAAAWGMLLAGPRLTLDRLRTSPLATVKPDRDHAQRWPLLPLADWEAGRIPVCVVDGEGEVRIEGEIEPVAIRDDDEPEGEMVIG